MMLLSLKSNSQIHRFIYRKMMVWYLSNLLLPFYIYIYIDNSHLGLSSATWFIVIYKSTCPENYIPTVMPPPNHTSPPFLQHVLWRCCNPPGIPPSTAGILLFNSVFHDRVIPVSVSTLKPLLRVIGVLPLKPWASPIISVVYKTSSYTVIR